MKTLLLLTACFIFYNTVFSQKDDGLSGFLNRSLTEILKERNDSLTNELNNINSDSRAKEKKSSLKSYSYQHATQFLLFLAKLENNQPLIFQDSLFIEGSSPHDSIYNLVLFYGALEVLNEAGGLSLNEDSTFLDAFPKLNHLYLTHKLEIRAQHLEAAEVPAIMVPPLPVLASGNASAKDKNMIASMWLNYINQAASVCGFPPAALAKYLSIEKTKVPNGNLDKLIELRQKCAMFIQTNYCHK